MSSTLIVPPSPNPSTLVPSPTDPSGATDPSSPSVDLTPWWWSKVGSPDTDEQPHATARMFVGAAGRIWLWFLVGCLLIATLPVLIGWRSYLIQTGSMRPAIRPGDVVLASSPPPIDKLGGRVIVFNSPDVPGRIITHRVVEISPSGELRTKGDHNQSADSSTITTANVIGIGRLLVKFIGLPVLWAEQGNFVALGLFLVSILIAGLAIRFDRDEEFESGDDVLDESASPNAPPPPPPYPFTLAEAPPALSAMRPSRRPRISSTAVFVVLVLLYAIALLVPTAFAALSTTTTSVANTWSVPQFSTTTEVTALTPYLQYPLTDASGTTAADVSGNGRNGTYVGGITYGVTGPLVTDTPNTAVTLTNATSCIVTPNSAKLTPAPTVYSSLAWFKTPNGYNQGGKILGFESARTGVSDSSAGGQYDRHVYMDGSGYIRFGVWLGYSFTLASTSTYNDGNWHMVATTMGAAGMKLYVDGVLQASSANTASEVFSNGGWWRFGCGNLSGWSSTSGTNTAWSGPNPPVTQQNYPLLGGSMAQATIWQNRVLTDSEVAFIYFAR